MLARKTFSNPVVRLYTLSLSSQENHYENQSNRKYVKNGKGYKRWLHDSNHAAMLFARLQMMPFSTLVHY